MRVDFILMVKHIFRSCISIDTLMKGLCPFIQPYKGVLTPLIPAETPYGLNKNRGFRSYFA